MKKFNRLIGTAAALLLTVTACSNSFTPQNQPAQQQNGGAPYSPEALATPLTLEAVDGAVVTFDNKAAGPVTYKVNGGEAQTIASGDSANITLAAVGDKVEFFGANKAYATNTSNCSNISCDKDCYVYGNIMSLVKSEGFENATTLENAYTFARLFADNAHIKNKSGADLLLPAATLADYCYHKMFSGCTSLMAAPSLPATTLAKWCYDHMFQNCASLTAAPALPATTLAENCYKGMFSGCASLTAAPNLSATTLASVCYGGMFSGCTSLVTAPSLSATTLAENCYSDMFSGCTSLTAAPELKATTLANYCYQYMFNGCTSLTAAPELKATTLAEGCYQGMFQGCASLTAAPSLPAITLAERCYQYMFSGCTSLAAAPSLSATTLAKRCYSGMFSGCTSLASVTCLATDISASDCTLDWLKNVAASGTFTKADGMTGWTTDSASGIPSGWTVRDFSYSVPLTLEAAEAGAVVTFSNKAAGPVTYKVNGGEAQTIASGATGTITLANVGDKVEFFGDNNAYATSASNYSNIACSADCYVYGNIMSLVKSQGFEKATTLENAYTFARLFADNTHIKNKSGADLLLPATTLAGSCYYGMFNGCTSLTAVPSLPAATLANSCYRHMFYGCTSLTAAPELPAATLAPACYMPMFYGCTSLTAAPSLPAATLANSCYMHMFYGCTSLASVTCLATDISASNCTKDWLKNVAASGTFTKADGMTGWTRGASGIPSGWTYNEEAPLAIPLTLEAAVAGAVVTFSNKADRPVTYKVNGGTAQTIEKNSIGTITLANIGDKVEFFGDNKAYATNLGNYSKIACSADCYVYGNIMSLVKSEGFENATTLENAYTFARLFADNTHIKNKSGAHLLLPATTLADSCYSWMFYGCASLTAAPSLPATTLTKACYEHMFYGCASLTAAPSLPATTLAQSCYSDMFSGCTSLKAAPDLPATTLAIGCYINMFRDCASLTAAPSLPATTLMEACYPYMFQGCASLTAAPALPATTLAVSCYYSMFNGCTSLTAAPSLPATTLAIGCYSNMFQGCTSLASVTCLATNVSAIDYTEDWLDGVAASGTFTKAAGITWPEGSSGIPSGWNVVEK